MKATTPLRQATEDLETAIAPLTGGIGISVRLLKIVKSVIGQWADSKTLEEIGSLTDSELLRKFAVSGAVSGALESREARKLARRAAAKIQFFESLEMHGGILKSQGVAQILQVSRQTVNNHVQKRKILAIQEGNDYCYPAFQFTDSRKLPHFEEVLEALGQNSAESMCTFFLNPITLGDKEPELPYVLLKNGVDAQQLKEILREANLFMSGTPS